MSVPRRNSTSPMGESTRELKARVISCLNRLSDRDTLTAATNELEAIARGLSRQDSFTTFLSCIHTTDSGEKSLVRRQCVRVLGLLAEAHGDDLAPHLAKMVATVVRRLKDSDSAVRLACVEAVGVMASRITKPGFAVAFLKSFMDVVSVEQDYNSQIGAAMCLTAAIEAAPDPEPAQLSKAVPKLLKLAKSECFKAKPALISLMGSILGAGGCSNHGVLDSVVSCALEFLSSEDWAARKSAVEVLERLVVTDREIALEYSKSCVATLESRKFDKVKVVREAMNQTLKLWKDVGIDGDELSPSSETQSQSSSRDTISVGCSPLKSPAKSSQDSKNETPRSKKSVLPSRSPTSSNSSQTRLEKPSPMKKNGGKSNIIVPPKFNGHTDWKVEVAVPRAESPRVVWDDKLEEVDSEVVKNVGNEKKVVPRLDSKPLLFSTSNINGEVKKHEGSKTGSRVFPVLEDNNSERTFTENLASDVDDICGDNETEGLSIVQQKLLHIENQQSNLLDLLQRFMGSSQNGMNALESRVHGLEMALDEISHDLAMSNGRMSSSETCCKLPGAEFLSPKFWRRSEGKYFNSKMNSPETIRSPASRHVPFRNESAETQKLKHDQRIQSQDSHDNALDTMDFSGQAQNFNQSAQRAQTPNTRKFIGSAYGSYRTSLYT
uniref:TORTIFOLIA1/SINE1-2 N-terminal domain-containing protein n=1 Tax=Kalanchoe fedtschenkoi TaxID=63787 RepID=A0A7N0ULI2_KALFE